ncbi:MAG: glutamate-1-semialdehyde 2,1-aminomutase [Cellvibrionaceae bacterium]
MIDHSDYKRRLLKAIPGGAHTYSRGYDQYPENAPQIFERGEGAYAYTPEGDKFLDFGMALRSVNIGYAQREIVEAAYKYMGFGNNLTRPSTIELEAAERLIATIPSVDMVKFTKNGSTAVTAAVKLARGYTGKDRVLVCADHPFFSYDDWFIGSTSIQKGIPQDTVSHTLKFQYNNIDSVKTAIAQGDGNVACLVMEPATVTHPVPSESVEGENFLHDVQRLCRQYGIVLILDEMITGFRWGLSGAQGYYGIEPDLCTFGKAMANGFSVAAVAGRRELMALGSIEKAGDERLFLLSSTHGAEMNGLGAFVATMNYLEENQVIQGNWEKGQRFIDLFNQLSQAQGVSDYYGASGIACSPLLTVVDSDGRACPALRTLLMQELIKEKVLMPWVSIAHAHGDAEFEKLRLALVTAFAHCDQVIRRGGVQAAIEGDTVKPVFRKYN